MKHPHRRPKGRRGDDQGAALIFALVFTIIGSLIVIPLLEYGFAVSRSSRTLQSKTARAEAVKAAFRTAMADPDALYAACAASGLTTEVELAIPALDIPIETSCTTVGSTTQHAGGNLRMAMTTTWAGSTAPPGTVGDVYVSPVPDPTYWPADSTTTSVGGKILLPELPVQSSRHPSTAGYPMPAWAGDCRVFFPGTYDTPLNISGTTPMYFASGVYYFTSTLTITGSANVVFGGGSTEGCTNDQDAAFFAVGAPTTHSITGFGATLIFGGSGRLVIDDTLTAGSGVDVHFNNRLVGQQEVTVQASAEVSIATVNGTLSAGSIVATDIPGQLFVPENQVNNGVTAADATTAGYEPSTLLPTGAPPLPGQAVVEINLMGTNESSVTMDGYVAVPQGVVAINTNAAAAANKEVALIGGVLAAQVSTTVDVPASMTAGLVNRVVQRTFKIVSTTTTGMPKVTSEAIVKVNEYGVFRVSNWVVQS